MPLHFAVMIKPRLGVVTCTCVNPGGFRDLSPVFLSDWSSSVIYSWVHRPNGHTRRSFTSLYRKKGKDKVRSFFYSASSRTPLMLSDMDHTVLPANNTISAFTRKHSPRQRHHAYMHSERLSSIHLLLIYLRKEDEWLSWPCWLTYSGRFTPKRSPVNCTSWRRPGKVRRS